MTEHTPGPWIADGPPSNIHILEEARPHMRVCFMTSDGPTVANARLIAAAPDLLRELRGALCPGGGYGGRQPKDEYPSVEACLKADACGCSLGAAVAKAEPASPKQPGAK